MFMISCTTYRISRPQKVDIALYRLFFLLPVGILHLLQSVNGIYSENNTVLSPMHFVKQEGTNTVYAPMHHYCRIFFRWNLNLHVGNC